MLGQTRLCTCKVSPGHAEFAIMQNSKVAGAAQGTYSLRDIFHNASIMARNSKVEIKRERKKIEGSSINSLF